jgi:hypothetical protein
MVGFSSVIICWLVNASALGNNGSHMPQGLKHSLNAPPCSWRLSTPFRLDHRHYRPIENTIVHQRQCGANPALLFEFFATEGQELTAIACLQLRLKVALHKAALEHAALRSRYCKDQLAFQNM